MLHSKITLDPSIYKGLLRLNTYLFSPKEVRMILINRKGMTDFLNMVDEIRRLKCARKKRLNLNDSKS